MAYISQIFYVSRDEIEKLLQIIVPETTPNQGEPDSPEGLEIGSKNVSWHPYFWSEPTLSLIEQFSKTYKIDALPVSKYSRYKKRPKKIDDILCQMERYNRKNYCISLTKALRAGKDAKDQERKRIQLRYVVTIAEIGTRRRKNLFLQSIKELEIWKMRSLTTGSIVSQKEI